MKKSFLTMLMLGTVVTAVLGGCSTNQSLSPSDTSLEPSNQAADQDELSQEENEASDSSNGAAETDVHTEQDTENAAPPEKGADIGTAGTDSDKGASQQVKPANSEKPSSGGQKSDGQKPQTDSGNQNSGAQKPQSNASDQKGENEKSQSNNTTKEAFVIDDYMTMNDSLETFTAFVNRRTDFSAEEKKKIIDARSRQLEMTDQLMKEYKAILTEEEMEAYLVQPVGEALEAGILPANDTYDQAVKKIEAAKKTNSEISRLTKELKEVQGGVLKTFTDKVQKEKAKLLGF